MLVRRRSSSLTDWALTTDPDAGDWLSIDRPMTVLAALRAHGQWSFDDPGPPSRDVDGETWWFRARAARKKGATNLLRIGGLATLADVFLDGEHVLRSENMFHAHAIDLDSPSGGDADDDVEVRFRFDPLNAELAKKKPRPRWKTRLASHQQLRYLRTSLVGRMPGWSPPTPPVGPWRDVVVEHSPRFVIDDADVRTRIDGEHGKVTIALGLEKAMGVERATLIVGDVSTPLSVTHNGDVALIRGEITIPRPKLWWPHTHGEPDRYRARVKIDNNEESEIDLGHVAFRSVKLDTANKRFALLINGVPVFCRGACWTTTDVVSLIGEEDAYRAVLRRVHDAGMNMLRLSGTMFYESDTFYEICDELGILVWQDFAFANMDYPMSSDEAFRASVVREANELTDRLQSRPCIAMFCGGSEVEQQAAMFGAAREIWRGPLEEDVLPAAVTARCPDVPYWPNSPSGGGLPFHVDEGAGHYYGVGAYLRPLEDARRANVKFASECLAFANVPEDDLFPLILKEGQAPIVSARWKERSSKDHGSAWDFEDVRDHYLRLLFDVDPAQLRYENMAKYLQLARVTTGEVMARTMNELRTRSDSVCGGALVWFLQDLWPGAGWGILDSRGSPKAPYWFLRRVLNQRVQLAITDEGVNGLYLHLVNDRATKVAGGLSVSFFRGDKAIAGGTSPVVIPPRSSIDVSADSLLTSFVDSAHAYRFGPPNHDLVVASLMDPQSGETIASAHHLGKFASPPACSVIDVEATFFRAQPHDQLAVTIRSKRFLHAVSITVSNHLPDDNYFDILPGSAKTVTLRPISEVKRTPPTGTLAALNLPAEIPLHLSEEKGASDEQ
jgi:beta-mannosidase